MDTLYKKLDELVPALLEEYGVPGAGVAVVKDDQVAYARGFGIRELGKPEPVDERTIFAVGSCTKAFTATAVGMLVQAGQLGWDDPVTRYLPSFQLSDPVATREITVRDLLCHRAGLATFAGDFMFYASKYSDEEALERVRHIPLAFRLRAGFGYANLMYAAAGLVIEKVSGLGWHDFIQQRLIQPLGLERTYTHPGFLEGDDNVAQPHQLFNNELVKVPFAVLNNGAGAGSIVSSAAGMANWLRFQLNQGRVGEVQWVESAILDETRVPHVLVPLAPRARAYVPRRHFSAYGLGWGLEDYGGRLVVSHGGGVDGHQSLVAFLPEENFGIVILTNRIPHYVTTTVLRSAVDTVLGFDDRDWRAVYAEGWREERKQAAEARRKLEEARPQGTRPSLPLEAYAGTYSNPVYGPLTVTEAGGRLQVDLGAHPQAAGTLLEHWHTDTFFCRWNYSTLEESFLPFTVGLDGRVSGLRLKVSPNVDNLEYEFTRIVH